LDAPRAVTVSNEYVTLKPLRLGHRGLEIGFTWYAKAFQRTHLNTATKLALFRHAFESLGAHRVQLQTDARNQASQRAIERIGAVKAQNLRRMALWLSRGPPQPGVSVSV
jgi:RimJ/RimL family protein N-acetyltransferase